MTRVFVPARSAANDVRLPLLLGALVLASWALASDEARLEIGPAYDDLLTDEIYREAEGWREPPMFDSEWRAPPPQNQGRIRLGFDSAHEELQARQRALSAPPRYDFREPRPSTLFRWEF